MDPYKQDAVPPMKAVRLQRDEPPLVRQRFRQLHDTLVTSPRALPDLRLTMLDRWREDGFYNFTHRAHEARKGRLSTGKAFDPIALREAQLWYVTPEMCKLVAHAAQSLPPTTLCDDLVPAHSPYGLVAWGEPMIGTDVEDGGSIAISLNLWGPTYKVGDRIMMMLDGRPPEPGRWDTDRTLTIANYRFDPAPSSPSSAYLPAGTSDWLWGTETHDALDAEIDPIVTASASEERRWLAALWLLAAQPLTSEVTQPAERAARKRSTRQQVSSDVRLIDVRRAKRSSTSDSDSDERHVEWRQRWIVEGHWRQQAYGPGRSLRRPTWIDEFVKGPEDKPLKVRDDVRVVRAGDERLS